MPADRLHREVAAVALDPVGGHAQYYDKSYKDYYIVMDEPKAEPAGRG
jgi:hypothetical protein